MLQSPAGFGTERKSEIMSETAVKAGMSKSARKIPETGRMRRIIKPGDLSHDSSGIFILPDL